MAAIKSYTDLEQSRELAKVLPIESADMEYMFLKKDGSKVSNVPFVKDGPAEPDCCYNFIPCWSLAALLKILGNAAYSIDEDASVDLGSYKNIAWCLCLPNTDVGGLIEEDNPVDACYEMILKLHELKML